MKQLRKPEYFLQEDRVSRSLCKASHQHENLISLLATYRIGSKCCLVLPWAECDLLKYWREKHPGSSQTERERTLVWLAEQCRGIAEGLLQIHHYETKLSTTGVISVSTKDRSQEAVIRLYGRHADIKPQNILWFPDPNQATNASAGILKIADFGISDFNKTDGWQKGGRRIPHTPPYRPPECDSEDGLIGPLYDIWALGCVYLEFITWWVGGWKSVEAFSRNRLAPDDEIYKIPGNENLTTDCFFILKKGIHVVKRPVTNVSVRARESESI